MVKNSVGSKSVLIEALNTGMSNWFSRNCMASLPFCPWGKLNWASNISHFTTHVTLEGIRYLQYNQTFHSSGPKSAIVLLSSDHAFQTTASLKSDFSIVVMCSGV